MRRRVAPVGSGSDLRCGVSQTGALRGRCGVRRGRKRGLGYGAVGAAGTKREAWVTVMQTAVLFDVAPSIYLAADTFGDPDAPAVLLLHGGGQTRHAWHTPATNLADAGWHAITVDLRGHGESTHPRPPAYALEDFTADVRALTSSIAGDPIVIGASLGGIAALVLLTESQAAPAAGLVLVDVAHRFQPRGGGRIVSFMGEHPDGFATLSDAADAVASYLPQR